MVNPVGVDGGTRPGPTGVCRSCGPKKGRSAWRSILEWKPGRFHAVGGRSRLRSVHDPPRTSPRMIRHPPLVVLAVAGALLASGCGDDRDGARGLKGFEVRGPRLPVEHRLLNLRVRMLEARIQRRRPWTEYGLSTRYRQASVATTCVPSGLNASADIAVAVRFVMPRGVTILLEKISRPPLTFTIRSTISDLMLTATCGLAGLTANRPPAYAVVRSSSPVVAFHTVIV